MGEGLEFHGEGEEKRDVVILMDSISAIVSTTYDFVTSRGARDKGCANAR